jgi:hypothetical protein
MKFLIGKFLIISMLFVSSTFAGQETRNGAGAAEQNFAYALTILKSLYKSCLNSNNCISDFGQKAVLTLIYRDISHEGAQLPPLDFDRSRLQLEDFIVDGQERIAFTDMIPGAKIYINRNLIYRKSAAGLLIPYSIGEAISLLTHELGHQALPTFTNHAYLDLIGAQVRAFYERENPRVIKDDFLNSFTATNVYLSLYHEDEEKSHVWLNIDDAVFDITEEIKSKLSCNIPHHSLESYRVGRLSWGDEELGRNYPEIIYPLNGQILLNCHRKDGAMIKVRLYLRLKFHFLQQDLGRLLYEPGKIEVETRLFQ